MMLVSDAELAAAKDRLLKAPVAEQGRLEEYFAWVFARWLKAMGESLDQHAERRLNRPERGKV